MFLVGSYCDAWIKPQVRSHGASKSLSLGFKPYKPHLHHFYSKYTNALELIDYWSGSKALKKVQVLAYKKDLQKFVGRWTSWGNLLRTCWRRLFLLLHTPIERWIWIYLGARATRDIKYNQGISINTTSSFAGRIGSPFKLYIIAEKRSPLLFLTQEDNENGICHHLYWSTCSWS